MNRQLLAQVGVFALLGLNVGAYYAFWPPNENEKRSDAQAVAAPKAQTKLLPTKLEARAPIGAAPLQIVKPPTQPPAKKDDDKLIQLLEHIQKEQEPKGTTVSRTRDVPPRDEALPRDVVQVGDIQIPLTPPIAPRTATLLWSVTMEKSGNQSLVVAKLNDRPIEFRILCDQVETNSPAGAVQAIGKVTITGAGLKGTCQRLTIPLQETHLIFEEKVHLEQNAFSLGVLRGERIVWEPALRPAELLPAEFRPTDWVAPLSK